MNKLQEKALENARRDLLIAKHDEIYSEDITEHENGTLTVSIVTQIAGCKSKYVEQLTRQQFIFNIGTRGKCFVIKDSKNGNYRKEYIGNRIYLNARIEW